MEIIVIKNCHSLRERWMKMNEYQARSICMRGGHGNKVPVSRKRTNFKVWADWFTGTTLGIWSQLKRWDSRKVPGERLKTEIIHALSQNGCCGWACKLRRTSGTQQKILLQAKWQREFKVRKYGHSSMSAGARLRSVIQGIDSKGNFQFSTQEGSVAVTLPRPEHHRSGITARHILDGQFTDFKTFKQ